MAYGITKERKLQIGLESSAGTAVPATAVIRGPVGTIVDTQETVIPDENIGYATAENRSYIPYKSCEYAQPETEATYEQTPVIMAGGIDDIVAGSAIGSTPTAYSYAYAAPQTNGAAATKYFTLEVGNNSAAHEMEYSFVSEFSLKGAINQAVMQSATWQGRQKTSTTFTGALTAPSVEEILFNKGKLYYDAFGGTIGSTQVTGQWLGFNLNHVTGWKRVFTGDGQLYFTLPVFKAPDITGDITIEDNTLAATLRTAQQAGTTGLIRMEFAGSTNWTGGTFATKIMRIDLAVKWLSIPGNESQDDDDILTIPWRAVRTASVYCTYTFVNSLATIAS